MTPYYDDGRITIYHADCRDVLPDLTADAMVTDPPYGIGLTVKRARNRGRGGDHEVGRAETLYDDDPDTVVALIREAIPLALSRVDRAIIFPGPARLFDYPRPAAVGAVWMPAAGGHSPWGFQTSQPILYYGACPYLASGLGNRPTGFHGKSLPEDGLDHPCPKPVEWMRWAVARVSLEGETVLDPMMGSGTTLVAAKYSGRSAIGIDVSERYCEVAASRLAQTTLEFGPPLPPAVVDVPLL